MEKDSIDDTAMPQVTGWRGWSSTFWTPICREGYIERRVYPELIEKCIPRQRSPNSWYNMGFFMRILRVQSDMNANLSFI